MMANVKQLELMYQQWIQENNSYIARWQDFVELAVRETGVTAAVILTELDKTTWFKRTHD
jgi:hypothetical protein